MKKNIISKQFNLAVLAISILLFHSCTSYIIDVYCAIDNHHSNIYVVGQTNNIGMLWLNCASKNITKNNYGILNSVFVSGTDIYFAGKENGKPKVWKNEISTDLPTSNNFGEVSALFVKGNDVYATGNVYKTGIANAIILEKRCRNES